MGACFIYLSSTRLFFSQRRLEHLLILRQSEQPTRDGETREAEQSYGHEEQHGELDDGVPFHELMGEV